MAISDNHVVRKTINKITECLYYSIVVDTTQDIRKIDQLSIIIRYVVVEYGQPIKISESFIGYYEIYNQSAAKFETKLLNILEENKIDLKKCKCQGYDGTANMSANYILCASHNLNLIMNDFVKGVLLNKIFYDLVQTIYVFINESLPRWQTLNETLKKILLRQLLNLYARLDGFQDLIVYLL